MEGINFFDESHVWNEALVVPFIYRPEFYNFIPLKYEDIKYSNKEEFLKKLIWNKEAYKWIVIKK